MADVITRFKLETTQYDSKLRDASKGLAEYTRQATQAGNEFGKFTQKNIEAARALGSITPSATNAKDKVKELVGAFNDAAKAYNALTKEQQQSDFGKAMAESISQLSDKIREAKQELYDMGDAAKKAGSGGLFSGLGDKMSGAMQVFAGNMLTKAAGAVANLGSEIFSSVQQGVELARQGEGIRIAFERLGRGDILDGLRQATHGTVTDLELMKAAVKFNDFKLPVEELGTMLAFAQQKAKDTGQSVDYMVESLVTGLGRKSLMILDNLGLSATEVKEKMAETGDMTKAVGAIIREQMSKAGDYVETAADRAAQANVSLQNKMEELGRKFAPLEEASNSLWTSMKIGILDVVGGPLTDLLNKLTQAGRMANQYGLMGGNAKVGRMTSNLASASEGNRQSIYQQQQAQFWKYINPREQQLKDIRAWQSGDRNEALQKRIGDITEKYGSLDATKIQAEVDAAKKMLSDYQAAAKQILQPIEQQIVPTVGDGGNSGGGGGRSGRSSSSKSEPTFAPDSIAAQQKLVADLTRQWNEAGAEVRNQYVVPLVEAEAKLKEMRDQQALMKEQAQGKLLGDTSDGKGIEVPISSSASFEEWMNSVKEQLANLKIDPIEIPIETTKKDVMAIAKSASITADVVGSIGDAFNAIEDPAAKVMGTVMQAIASVALGYAQATVEATSMGPWAWVAFAATGLATMLSTISAIHSATGYATGGMVEGNTYSGDQIPAMLNAGEVVLNRAQQGNLASQLEGGGMRNMNLSGRIRGTDIILSVDRTLSLEGKQLLTWGR
jgi:hypothetical protein